jgi:hypothetical protein
MNEVASIQTVDVLLSYKAISAECGAKIFKI